MVEMTSFQWTNIVYCSRKFNNNNNNNETEKIEAISATRYYDVFNVKVILMII